MDDDGLKKSDRSIESSSVRKTDKTVSVELTDGSGRTSKITTTILIVLLVISITVGCVFAYLYFNNNTQKIAETVIVDSENNKIEEVGENSEDDSPIVSLEQVDSLLRGKYELKPITEVFIDGWPKYIEKLDQANKILFTVYQIQRDNKFSSEQYLGNDPVVVKNVSYDDFNDAYSYYFGSGEPLEKNDYKLDSIISKIIYRSEDDSYDVYFPDGIGGASTTRMLSKVDGVTKTKDGFKATILAVTLDSVVRQDVDDFLGKSGDGENWFYEILMTDGVLDEIRDSLSAYEFNFVDEAGEYKLVSIEKI